MEDQDKLWLSKEIWAIILKASHFCLEGGLKLSYIGDRPLWE